MPICLHTVCGCFCAAAAAEMNSCNRVYGLQSRKYLLWSLREKLPTPPELKGALFNERQAEKDR